MKQQQIQYWLIKRKLYHTPIWLVYELLLSALFGGKASWEWQSIVLTLFYALAHAAGSYANIYYLIPRVLRQGKVVQYVLLFILNCLISPLLIVLGFWIVFEFDFSQLAQFFAKKNWFGAVYLSSWMTILGVSIFHTTAHWITMQKRNSRLKKEKLEAELKFLRSQFNPHFLFNTINSIFFLIQKDPDQASASLVQFSDLLRYQLYECNEPQIDLIKEVGYLQNFIELEKLRQSDCLSVQLDVVNATTMSRQIAPFLLMPFIENAFKHVSKGREQENFIYCKLEQQNEMLHFEVKNSAEKEIVDRLPKKENPYGGIGLENVKRRLSLLYPKHELNITQKDSVFSIQLTLQLLS